MCFFENDYFLNILKQYKDKTFPMLVPVIVHLAENHWHKILQESLIALKTILKEIDPYAFEDALKMKPEQQKQFRVKQEPAEREQLDINWERLNAQLKSRQSDFEPAPVPFTKTALIRDFNPLYFKVYDKVKAVEL